MKDRKEYSKAYRQAHKEQAKAWREAHKEQTKAYQKAYKQVHKEQTKAYQKAYKQAHKEQRNAYTINYMKNDVNSFGESKNNIRSKSRYILKKYGTKIPDYEIHHCFGYEDPTKFIYCSKEMHHLIHSYLRQHNIDADSDHYKYIKHLLDDTVFKYNIDD